jgi:hypothetical protein
MPKQFLRLNAAFAILFSPFFISAQTIQTNAKLDPTVNYERLSQIDSLINSYIKNNWLAGAVTIIVKDNQLIQYKGYGYQDFESKKRCCLMLFFASCLKQKQ